MVIEDTPLARVAAAAVRGAGTTGARLDVDPGLRVLADAQQLEKVITELVGNAVRHGGDRVDVRVDARERDGVVSLRVVDDGTGIDPELVESVFVPFERGDDAGAGLGLGLSLARRTIQAMGGALTGESVPGRGTTMTLSLPAGTPQMEGERGDARLLYVDDDVSNLRLVEKILAGRPDMSLHVATTGAEGVAAATEELPDLILLDLNLPDVPGAEIVKTLRSDPRTSTIPILVITIEDDPAVLAMLRDLGVADVVTKPFDSQVLIDTVMARLDERVR